MNILIILTKRRKTNEMKDKFSHQPIVQNTNFPLTDLPELCSHCNFLSLYVGRGPAAVHGRITPLISNTEANMSRKCTNINKYIFICLKIKTI